MSLSSSVPTPDPIDAARVSITLFPAATEPHGERHALTWADLRAELADVERRDTKGGPLWSPATFCDDRRATRNVEQVYAVGLDFDGGMSLDEIEGALDGLEAVLHTTHSSSTEEPRYRAVVLLARPVDAAGYARAWAELDRRCGGRSDAACKDAARQWYPAIALDGAPFDFRHLRGRPFDPDAAKDAELIDLLGHAWPEKGRHVAQRALAGTLVRQDIPADRALEILCGVCRVAGDEDRGKRATTIAEVYARHAAGEPVPESATLIAALPADVGQRACEMIARIGAPGLSAWIDRIRTKAGRGPANDTALTSVGRAIIYCDSQATLAERVDQACDALRAAPNLYQSGATLRRVVDEELPGTDVRAPQIRDVPHATLKCALSDVAEWCVEIPKGGARQVDPPDDVVRAVAERGEWPGVPVIVGVTETPLLRADGSILCSPGFDRATGYYYVGAAIDVPEAPTKEDAENALSRLRAVFADFPEAEPSRMVAVAAILTIVGRAAIRGSTPTFVFDASTRGSGKTLKSDVVSIIATGRPAARTTFPPSEEELEKILGSYALRGVTLVSFDNVNRPLGGAALDKYATAVDRVDVRVLGQSKVSSCPWTASIIATGNNIDFCGDMSRRVLVSRITPDVARPEDRNDFVHPDLRAWVSVNRWDLVRDALVVLRAYTLAGRPDVGIRSWGGFEPWCSLVAGAIAWAGGVDVTEARPDDDSDAVDPEKAKLVALVSALDGRGAMTAAEIIAAAEPRPGAFGSALVVAVSEIAPIEEKNRAKVLGKFCRRQRDRVVEIDGVRKRLTIRSDSHANANVYEVTAVG